jgi:hypothetical protein
VNHKNLIAGFLVLLTLPVIGCGGSGGSSGSSGNSSTPPMTKAQAAAAFTDVFTAMEEATIALPLVHSGPVSQLRKEEAAEVREAILNGARNSAPAYSISPALKISPDTTTTIPSFTYQCPSGGTIVVTGSYSETSTSESASIVDTINSCKDSGVTFKGDPNIAISLTGSDNGTTTTVTLTMTGGISVGSSSCSTDLSINASANNKTGNGTVTYNGSFCGETISGSETI